MNVEQAWQIIDLLKKGKSYREGHYHYGYITFSYDNSLNQFEIKREDLSTNIFEPEITKEYLAEKQFVEYLMKFCKYEKMIQELI